MTETFTLTINGQQLFGPEEETQLVVIRDQYHGIKGVVEVPADVDLDYEMQEYADYQRAIATIEEYGLNTDEPLVIEAVDFEDWLIEKAGAKTVDHTIMIDPGW